MPPRRIHHPLDAATGNMSPGFGAQGTGSDIIMPRHCLQVTEEGKEPKTRTGDGGSLDRESSGVLVKSVPLSVSRGLKPQWRHQSVTRPAR